MACDSSSPFRISRRSANKAPRYSQKTIVNMASVRHLEFEKFRFFGQISLLSANMAPRYSQKTIINMADGRHLEFAKLRIFVRCRRLLNINLRGKYFLVPKGMKRVWMILFAKCRNLEGRKEGRKEERHPNSGKLAIHPDHPHRRIKLKLCMVGGLRFVVIHVKCDPNRLSVMALWGSKMALSYYFGQWLIQQLVLPYKP